MKSLIIFYDSAKLGTWHCTSLEATENCVVNVPFKCILDYFNLFLSQIVQLMTWWKIEKKISTCLDISEENTKNKKNPKPNKQTKKLDFTEHFEFRRQFKINIFIFIQSSKILLRLFYR